jgi:hypothetical protein
LLDQEQTIHSSSDQDLAAVQANLNQPSDVTELDNDELEVQLLLDEIQSALETYSGSLSALSNKSGVDPKTIRKMQNGEYKRAPNAETVQRVLSVVSKQRTIKDLASFYGKNIEKYLKKCLPQFFVEDAVITDDFQFSEELNSKIKDIYTYAVSKIVSANNNTGTNKHDLIDNLCKFIIRIESQIFEEDISKEEISSFRPLATLKINQMIKSGLLIENRQSGNIHFFKSGFKWQVPEELYRKYEGDMINFYEPEHAQYTDEWWRLSSSACSLKEFNEISHIMFNAFQEARDILFKSESNEIKINLNTSLVSLKFHTQGEAREEALNRKRQKGEIQ